ncbi:histidine phosphatase family protein [Microbacterium sp. KUDC0406]|uniref:histidine phosphatase family protein n=1 Tax=Microbacterium sp. KUDC0406 TaxID=2909588 RepID=UPI001F3D7322|nr:histidine phosphatase family protein [Microbacterium sp. KUDC0406]UJP09918.1 histidine phosphatase family protein [Microbacterium sp. KUDC0406]
MSHRSPNHPRTRVAALVAVTLFAGVLLPVSAATAAPPERDAPVRTVGNLYGTKAVYEPFQDARLYHRPPASYHPVLVEHVSRHGSRLLSSKKYDDLLWQLWQIADADGGLTDLGEQLGPDLQRIIAIHDQVGYGTLSTRGAQEQQQIAERAVERMRPVFDAAVEDGRPIEIVSSGVDRAVDSADNFVVGLKDADPQLAGVIQPQVTDPDLLYFHDTDPEYLEYEDGEQLAGVEDELEQLPIIATTARDVVSRLFTPGFIARIDAGEFDLVDHGKGKTHLRSVVDVGSFIYELYVIAPGMDQDAAVDMTPYLTDEDAAVFAYLSDANDFYKKGPAFAGSDVTYRMAHVLVDEFLDSVEAVAAGETSPAAEFRFAHAEEIIPLAALLKLPGSRVAQPDDDLFSYDTNPWRGAQVAPMAANLQWDVYVGPRGRTIVRMLYNEKETAFAGDCTPIRPGSFFYFVDELTRCLADQR